MIPYSFQTGYVFGEFTDCESEQLLNDGKELVKVSVIHKLQKNFLNKMLLF